MMIERWTKNIMELLLHWGIIPTGGVTKYPTDKSLRQNSSF